MKSGFTMTALSVFAFTTGAQAAAPGGADAGFPTKPIRVVVPQGPSGSNDIMARYIGGMLAERVGRQVVVDNRPGAEGMIGTDIVAKAAPDGYTLLMASAAFTQNPAVIKKLPYDPVRDFDWVAIFGRAPVIITVGPSLQVTSLKDLIALGRSKPDLITMASAGGFMHFVSAMFRGHAKIGATIALYKGGAPALTDVAGGHAHMAVATPPTAAPYLRSGRVKPLAISSAKRNAAFPDIPTMTEAGLPSYDASIWWGWATAAHTPAAVVNKLNKEIAVILALPETAKRFGAEGADVEIHTPAEIRKMIATDLVKWAKVAQDAGMQKH